MRTSRVKHVACRLHIVRTAILELHMADSMPEHNSFTGLWLAENQPIPGQSLLE